MTKRKPLRITGVSVIDKDGNEEAFDPTKHQSAVAKAAAAIKTMETGKVWTVKPA